MGIAIGVGLLAGILGGMLGVGGGVILIPGMVFLMGVEQHTAQGVSLAVIAVMALVGTITHYRQKNVRLKVALWIIPAAVIFSFLGSMVADMLDASLLRDLVGGLIIVVGFFMVIKDWRSGSRRSECTERAL
jgi:uncharacterized membrane protein YfcA